MPSGLAVAKMKEAAQQKRFVTKTHIRVNSMLLWRLFYHIQHTPNVMEHLVSSVCDTFFADSNSVKKSTYMSANI